MPRPKKNKFFFRYTLKYMNQESGIPQTVKFYRTIARIFPIPRGILPLTNYTIQESTRTAYSMLERCGKITLFAGFLIYALPCVCNIDLCLCGASPHDLCSVTWPLCHVPLRVCVWLFEPRVNLEEATQFQEVKKNKSVKN